MKTSEKFWLFTLIALFILAQFIPIVREFELYTIIGVLFIYVYVAIFMLFANLEDEVLKYWNIFYWVLYVPIRKLNNWLDK